MGTDATEVDTLPFACVLKLSKLVDRISKLFPKIEAARPRCSSGIQILCSLNAAIERSKSVLEYGNESSKLYLAITGSALVSKLERSRDLLEQGFIRIQNMVPVMLAIEISQIIEDLRSSTFVLGSSEEQVGKALRALFQLDTSATDSIEACEIKTLKLVSQKLQIKSSKDLLIEKRSLKKQIDKFGDSDSNKRKILRYLLYLLKKYEKSLIGNQTENKSFRYLLANSRNTSLSHQSVEDHSVECVGNPTQNDLFSQSIPPDEFLCPLSMRLMHEPVVIDSGQTFDRIWIQKWFDEGNVMCPKTQKILTHFSMTPNIVMKDLISKWCMDRGTVVSKPVLQPKLPKSLEVSYASISSFGSSMNDLCSRMDLSDVSVGSLDTSFSSDYGACADSPKFQSYENTCDMKPEYLSQLDGLSWESQCKVVEEVKNSFIINHQAHYFISPANLIDPLIKFLKEARDRLDANALKFGSRLFLAFVDKSRTKRQYCFDDDVFSLLVFLLDSEACEESISIIEVVSARQDCKPKIAASGAMVIIVGILDNQTKKLRSPALKIMYNLSSNIDIHPLMIDLGLIQKMVPLFSDPSLSIICIAILRNLCDTEEAQISIAESEGCISSISGLLENGSSEERGHAVNVLVSFCSQRVEHCKLVMEEGVIPALVEISVNGDEKAKACGVELLRILRDVDYEDLQESSKSNLDMQGSVKDTKIPTKASGLFGRFSKLSRKKKEITV